MLKIRRSTPPSLYYEQTEEPRERLLQWAHRTPDERRQRRAPINHDMFYSGDVVDLVVSDFSGRCAYCERQIGRSEGISHFRPLSSPYEQNSEGFVDHYSWLAFEWLNLFLICRRCRKIKAEHFPVLDRRAAFLATFDEVRAEEKPLLIDPTSDNPSSHLFYLMSGECCPKKNSSKGNATVDILALNEGHLVEERRSAIDTAIQTWQSALEERGDLPVDFLLKGAFLGTCRDVLTRTLMEYGIESLSINNGRAFIRNLQSLLRRSDKHERERMLASVELVRRSDGIRSAELGRRSAVSAHYSVSLAPYAQPQTKLLSPTSELTAFSVSNFRAIDHVKIPLLRKRTSKSGANCLLLLGENAVGKSTCLSAIALGHIPINGIPNKRGL